MSKKDDPQFKLRLPPDLKEWIDQQSQINRSSKSSEIIRSVRERMERMELKVAA
ncbi:Arc family DNA-binding protein [Hydrocarboniphaga effusa]|uniref:Arc family DNA-binding protein n=1 Tax=Hydrocarboniphaga effusa TaxID=243629 RepID=UPI00398BD794